MEEQSAKKSKVNFKEQGRRTYSKATINCNLVYWSKNEQPDHGTKE